MPVTVAVVDAASMQPLAAVCEMRILEIGLSPRRLRSSLPQYLLPTRIALSKSLGSQADVHQNQIFLISFIEIIVHLRLTKEAMGENLPQLGCHTFFLQRHKHCQLSPASRDAADHIFAARGA